MAEEGIPETKPKNLQWDGKLPEMAKPGMRGKIPEWKGKFPEKAYDDPSPEVILADVLLGFAAGMALKAVCKLGIPDIIAKAGVGVGVTLEEMAAELPCKSPANAVFQLRRLFTVLVHRRLFTESVVKSESGELRTVYGLTLTTSMCRTKNTLVTAQPIIDMILHPVFFGAWNHLDALVLDPETSPMKASQGKDVWDILHDDPDTAAVFNKCMSTSSMALMATVLGHYQGFKDIKTLVDVGGGVGTTLSKIIAANPHIRGICVDLPHVVASATPIPGVEFVGGDMFQSIPSGGDAVILRRVLHDWDDEHCIKILKNCKANLPPHGKIIVLDFILEDPKDDSARAKLGYIYDLLIMTTSTGGRERTIEQWKALTAAAGLSSVAALPVPPFSYIKILEMYV